MEIPNTEKFHAPTAATAWFSIWLISDPIFDSNVFDQSCLNASTQTINAKYLVQYTSRISITSNFHLKLAARAKV